MGNATSDRTVYPVHTSRYTITTMDTSPLTEDGQDDDFGFEWDSDSCGARRQDSTSYPGEEGTWDPRHSGRVGGCDLTSESGQRAWGRLLVVGTKLRGALYSRWGIARHALVQLIANEQGYTQGPDAGASYGGMRSWHD